MIIYACMNEFGPRDGLNTIPADSEVRRFMCTSKQVYLHSAVKDVAPNEALVCERGTGNLHCT